MPGTTGSLQAGGTIDRSAPVAGAEAANQKTPSPPERQLSPEQAMAHLDQRAQGGGVLERLGALVKAYFDLRRRVTEHLKV